jgi:hypothetical protein
LTVALALDEPSPQTAGGDAATLQQLGREFTALSEAKRLEAFLSDGAIFWPLSPPGTQPALAPAPAPVLYALTGDSSGASFDSVAVYLRADADAQQTTPACDACVMRLVTAGRSYSCRDMTPGDKLSWARAHLRRRLPDGSLAGGAPSQAELEAGAAPLAAVDPQVSVPLALPPLDATTSRRTQAHRVVVFFDLEARGGKKAQNIRNRRTGVYEKHIYPESWRITEVAATAACLAPDGVWAVPSHGRFSAIVGNAEEFAPAATEFIAWLDTLREEAGGAHITMLAHNGVAWDWPLLTHYLLHAGLRLPPFVMLGCSRHLFIAEKRDEDVFKSYDGSQGFWALGTIFLYRFDACVKDEHTAVGDVRCAHAQRAPERGTSGRCTECTRRGLAAAASAMEAIFCDVTRRNHEQWVARVLAGHTSDTQLYRPDHWCPSKE